LTGQKQAYKFPDLFTLSFTYSSKYSLILIQNRVPSTEYRVPSSHSSAPSVTIVFHQPTLYFFEKFACVRLFTFSMKVKQKMILNEFFFMYFIKCPAGVIYLVAADSQ